MELGKPDSGLVLFLRLRKFPSLKPKQENKPVEIVFYAILDAGAIERSLSVVRRIEKVGSNGERLPDNAGVNAVLSGSNPKAV